MRFRPRLRKPCGGVWGNGGGRHAREKESEGRSAWDCENENTLLAQLGRGRGHKRSRFDGVSEKPTPSADPFDPADQSVDLQTRDVAAFDRFAIRWRAKRLGPFRSISDSGRETRACLLAVSSSSNCPFVLGSPVAKDAQRMASEWWQGGAVPSHRLTTVRDCCRDGIGSVDVGIRTLECLLFQTNHHDPPKHAHTGDRRASSRRRLRTEAQHTN